jgi:signal transduction histidine kinase
MRVSTWRAAGRRAPTDADRGQEEPPGGGLRPPPLGGTRAEGARGRAWRWYLAGGVLGCALYPTILLLPLPPMATEIAQAALYWLIALSGVAAIWVGIGLHRPPTPLAWHLLAAGLLFFALGDITFFGNLLVGREAYPSLADLLYLIAYPLIAAGLLVLVRARARGRERSALTDALIITIGLGLVVWDLLLKPSVSDRTMPLAATLISVAYPVMDLLLLAMAVRLVVGRARSTPALVLLLAGLCALLLADGVYAVLRLNGGYRAGGPVDLAYLAAYVLPASAALHPSMRALTVPRPGIEVSLSRRRIALLVGAGLLPALLLYADDREALPGIERPLLTSAVTLLAGLVFVRIAMLARRLAEQVNTNQRLLDRTVRAAEEERAQIAVDIHDGPIQRLAGVGMNTELVRRKLEKGRTHEALMLLEQIGDDVSSEIGALRRVMMDLHPPIPAKGGLATALRAQVDEFQRRTGIHSVLDADPVQLDRSRETVLYRVVQEALTNVAKHANAKNVWVALRLVAGAVKLIVLDDGEGFVEKPDRGEPFEPSHFGLAGMRQRAEMAGGTFEVRTRPGAGTMIVVTLPYPATA